MFEEFSKSLLRSGIIEAKDGNKDSARRYLDRALTNTTSPDLMCEAWYWMGMVTDEHVEKRKAFENCLAYDLHHARARRELAILDGKLKREDIVDPNQLPPASDEIRKASADRFMCPKCGGRMIFAPDGQTLICEYCARTQGLESVNQEAEEKDFIINAATVRGHSKPQRQQIFHCNGCGAEYILPPTKLSKTCSYCGSAHVIKLDNERELLAPAGIVPFTINQKQAAQFLIQWVAENKVKPEKKVNMPRGLYLPIWTFDIGGEVDYVGERVDHEDVDNLFKNYREKKVVRVNDRYPVLVNDMPIPASRKIAERMTRLLSTYQLNEIKPYDPRYLSNWPAEVYDIPMANASLDARGQVFKTMKRELPDKVFPVKLISSSSASMLVESFKLVLLPVWLTKIFVNDSENILLINGQNGAAQGEINKPEEKNSTGLLGWLDDILGD